jgi:hypothetical protein
MKSKSKSKGPKTKIYGLFVRNQKAKGKKKICEEVCRGPAFCLLIFDFCLLLSLDYPPASLDRMSRLSPEWRRVARSGEKSVPFKLQAYPAVSI